MVGLGLWGVVEDDDEGEEGDDDDGGAGAGAGAGDGGKRREEREKEEGTTLRAKSEAFSWLAALHEDLSVSSIPTHLLLAKPVQVSLAFAFITSLHHRHHPHASY
ncbi:hypothetical protein TWF506_000686 [Arthrobotrys conoides]|uniref:Uncharacterized protein n=1 Tax=Arthrobotrys conoides TaxID=74498 RepID=A0AAN8NRG5_9PEZI